MFSKRLLLTCCITVSCIFTSIAQTDFAPLSADVYKSRIEYLEKYKVPKNYTDKSAQAWYDEILTDRNKALLEQFKDNDLVHDTVLLNKCNTVFNRIKSANRSYNFDSVRIYINRSLVGNAACYGEGTIMVNLGLFLWIDNDDELAMVLGHELAHQLLKHSDAKIEKSISTLTSDEFKSTLKDIKKSDYGKYERFKNLMKGLSVESGKHSRYKETEADSLGVIFAKNAGYNTGNGAAMLLKLDKIDETLSGKNIYMPARYFEGAPIDFSKFKPKVSKYNGLSSVSVTMNADADMDSVKTHPDCAARYKAITGNQGTAPATCCTKLTEQNGLLKQRAMFEIVRRLYENNRLGLAIHFSLWALENNYDAVLYKRMLSLCFSKLYFEDANISRFNAANSFAKPQTTLKEVQDFLFAMPAKDLDATALYFLNQSNTESVDDAFARMMYNVQVKNADPVTAYAAFNKKFPNNKYQYLLPKK